VLDYDRDQSDLAATDDELARSARGVDPAWYLKVHPDVAAAGVDPVTHYLKFGWREGRDPRPDFSTAGYLTLNRDAALGRQNPLIHYLRNGGKSRGHAAATAWHLFQERGFLYPKIGSQPSLPTIPFGTPGRPKILFTGHEASRTGAPLILLGLMKAFERLTGAELLLILERGGPLLEDFRQVAHVLVNHHGALYSPDGSAMRSLLDAVANPGPTLAVCNCADSWRLMRELRSAGLPRIVGLVHERLALQGDETRQALLSCADRVVFPAEAVKAAAVCIAPSFRDAQVAPQGLLVPDFGRGDMQAARASVRQELGLPADTRIVLGCGTRIPRKGLDLYVQLASRVRSQGTVPAHFVWLGGDNQVTDFTMFVQHDIAVLDLSSKVSLVPQTTGPERFFLAADVFALTSRDDPFPCVVHEAMACALPIVLFDGAGGAGEAVAGGCGIAVPYLDIDRMAGVAISMLERPSDFAAMGKKAEQRVRSAYRFSDYARRILDICHAVQTQPALH
jgi:Glycosyl transferases group 1